MWRQWTQLLSLKSDKAWQTAVSGSPQSPKNTVIEAAGKESTTALRDI